MLIQKCKTILLGIPFTFLSFPLLTIGGLLLIGLFSCQKAPAPITDWPEITQESKPWTRWWWHGNSVTKEGIKAELEAYQKVGIGGLELTPIYGIRGEEEQFIPYLSSQWMDMLEFTLQEAERLGLGIDMATGTGWPFGGPWVSELDASKYLTYKTYILKQGESLKNPISYIQEPFVRQVYSQGIKAEDLMQPIGINKNLQQLAIDQIRFEKPLPLQSLMAYSNEGEILDLKSKLSDDKRLNWTAPSGSWTIYAVFQGWHGKMVERAAPGGEGNVIDHFSSDAIQHYLAHFDSAFSGRQINGLRAFFNDSYEVDDARGEANWTPKLLEEFQKRRGYNLQEYWPALFGKNDHDINNRVLSDLRETMSDLLLTSFTNEWEAWTKKYGKINRNQAHGSPANILDLYAASDIPETEGVDLVRIKFATSAANVSGKKLVSAESATWLNEHFLSNLADWKENLDRYLVGGVNHVFYHGSCYSPPDAEWPGNLFYAAIHANSRNPLWRDFPTLNQYIARTQSFLQQGIPNNDILLYLPAYDRFATPRRELLDHFHGHGPNLADTPFETNAKHLITEGFAFDYISDRQIQQLILNNETILSGNTPYQTVILPACQFIPLPTLEKLFDLAKNGGTIIFHKSLPISVPGLNKLEERLEKFHGILGQVNFEIISAEVKEAKIGAGRFLMGDSLKKLLDYASIRSESMVQNGLSFSRRSLGDQTCYFITNWSDKNLYDWIRIETSAKSMVLLDPMTGEKGLAKVRNVTHESTEVYLQLLRGSSCILLASPKSSGLQPWMYYEISGEPVELVGDWQLDFLEGGPQIPGAIMTDTLGSWTDYEGKTYANFSGTARYRIDFQKPDTVTDGWLLDLGQVYESARVYLNGKQVTTLIGPVYQVFLDSKLLKDTNTLDIEITNLMANRIADLDRREIEWKRFYNINFPPRLRENRGKDGLFDASSWEPKSSGLIGPVTFRMVNIMQ